MNDYYVLINQYDLPWPRHGEVSRTVYVKEGNFFVQQGGLREAWGASWIKVQADSIEHAREIGMNLDITEVSK